MKILLIGGCGYVGTRLYDELRSNHIVSVDLEMFGQTIDDNLHINYGVLTEDFLSDFDVVILMAGNSSVNMSKDFCDTHKNNVDNFLHLLNNVPKGVKLIYASSSSVYSGIHNATEESPFFVPSCYYDLTKFELDMYAQLSDVHYYGLRFGTINGFSRNLRSDLMINSMVLSCRNKGIFYYSNPRIHRPILDIKDLAEAVKVILEKGSYHNRGIYNLASFNSTVFDIAKKVSEITGVEAVETMPSEAYNFSINCSKFEDTFDFQFKGTVESIVKDLDKKPEIICKR
jgi:nucleoside-diphosphate-sugar epimerase